MQNILFFLLIFFSNTLTSQDIVDEDLICPTKMEDSIKTVKAYTIALTGDTNFYFIANYDLNRDIILKKNYHGISSCEMEVFQYSRNGIEEDNCVKKIYSSYSSQSTASAVSKIKYYNGNRLDSVHFNSWFNYIKDFDIKYFYTPNNLPSRIEYYKDKVLNITVYYLYIRRD